jgi:hypothetical protein
MPDVANIVPCQCCFHVLLLTDVYGKGEKPYTSYLMSGIIKYINGSHHAK